MALLTLYPWASAVSPAPLKPSDVQIANGFGLNAALPSAYVNWVLKDLYAQIKYFQDVVTGVETITNLVVDAATGVAITGTAHAGSGIYGSTDGVGSDPGNTIYGGNFYNTRATNGTVNYGVVGQCISGGTGLRVGVYGNGATYGVSGNSSAGNGVYGTSGTGTAIRGDATASAQAGVAGYNPSSTGFGVYGNSTNGYGMKGEGGIAGVWGSSAASGVYGETNFGFGIDGYATDDGVGCRGLASGSGAGVYGESYSGFGVQGLSTSGYAGNFVATANLGLFAQGTIGGIKGSASTGGMASVEGAPLTATGCGVKGSSQSYRAVWGTSSGSGDGVYGDSNSGNGVYGTAGIGYGVRGASSSSGTGGKFSSTSGNAIECVGQIAMTGGNTGTTTAVANKVTADNVIKAYGKVTVSTAGVVTMVSGFNASVPSALSDTAHIYITMLSPLVSDNEVVMVEWDYLTTWTNPPTIRADMHLTGTQVDVRAYEQADGSAILWNSGVERWFKFVVYGRQ